MAFTWREEYDLKKLLKEKKTGSGGSSCFALFLIFVLVYICYYLMIGWLEKVNTHMKSVDSRLERLEKNHERP